MLSELTVRFIETSLTLQTYRAGRVQSAGITVWGKNKCCIFPVPQPLDSWWNWLLQVGIKNAWATAAAIVATTYYSPSWICYALFTSRQLRYYQQHSIQHLVCCRSFSLSSPISVWANSSIGSTFSSDFIAGCVSHAAFVRQSFHLYMIFLFFSPGVAFESVSAYRPRCVRVSPLQYECDEERNKRKIV